MTSSDNRRLRTALIPWVMALVALFGVNALVPNRSRSERIEPSDEIGISQLATSAPTPGRIFNPLVFLTPGSSDAIGFPTSASLFLCVETRRDQPEAQLAEGSVQGRAPPVWTVSQV